MPEQTEGRPLPPEVQAAATWLRTKAITPVTSGMYQVAYLLEQTARRAQVAEAALAALTGLDALSARLDAAQGADDLDRRAEQAERRVQDLRARLAVAEAKLAAVAQAQEAIEQASRLLRQWASERQRASGKWTLHEQAVVDCAIKLDALTAALTTEPAP